MRKVETFEFQTGEGEDAQVFAVYQKTDVETKEVTFQGQTALNHPMIGQVPIGFSIDAENIKEAGEKYLAHAEVAKAKAMAQIEEQIKAAQVATPPPPGENLVGPDGSLLGAKNPPKGGPMQFPGGR